MSRAPVAGVQDPGAEPVCLTLTCSRHSLLKELFAEFYRLFVFEGVLGGAYRLV